jgi:hypothetical protein
MIGRAPIAGSSFPIAARRRDIWPAGNALADSASPGPRPPTATAPAAAFGRLGAAAAGGGPAAAVRPQRSGQIGSQLLALERLPPGAPRLDYLGTLLPYMRLRGRRWACTLYAGTRPRADSSEHTTPGIRIRP